MTQSFVSADQLAVDVALFTLKESLAAVMRYFERAAASGQASAESIHQLRISTRRANVSLEVFRNFLPRSINKKLQRKLTTLRKDVGNVRDIDVFVARLDHDPEDDHGQELLDRLNRFRADGQCALNARYEEWNRGEVIERQATDILCSIRPRRKQSDRPGELFGHFARRCLQRVTRRFFAEHDTDPKSLKRLHAFRIQVKGLRYCLELLRPGLPAEEFAKTSALLKKLAQRLGDINDHATAERLLESVLDEADRGPATKAIERALHDERRALGESLAKFKKWWSWRKQRRLRRWLKKTAEWTPSTEMARPTEG